MTKDKARKDVEKIKEAIDGSSELYSIGNIKAESINYIKKRALREEGNIQKIGHAVLSAFTSDPINLEFLASPSEGKTHVIVNTAMAFPDQYVEVYRDASPKSFTRDKGELAVRIIKNGTREYHTEIENVFTRETTSVSEYLNWLKSEIDSKESMYGKRELERAKGEITQNLVTLISLENKVIIFLDRPQPELLKSMLSVLSHDSYYTESMFVEGEGILHTKHIVFQGWPSFIIATTKDEANDFHDLESRFEVCEPVMTPEKYSDAISEKLNYNLGLKIPDNGELKELKRKNQILIERILKDNVQALAPFRPSEIFKILFDTDQQKIEHGDLMRKIPRLFQHIGLSCLWNLPDRVILSNGQETYAIISAEDIEVLADLYGDLEINSLLAGLPVSDFEFLTGVLAPAFRNADGDQKERLDRVELSTIREQFKEYIQGRENKTLKKDKVAFTRYVKFFEDRGYIEKFQDENDKRKKWVTLLVEPETLITSIKERVIKIGTSAKTLCEQYVGSLLNRNFTAFYKGQKIGTTQPKTVGKEKKSQNEESPKNPENTRSIINSILALSGYLPTVSVHVVPNFGENEETHETAQNKGPEENKNKENGEKSAITLGVPNNSSSESMGKNDSPVNPDLQGEPSDSDIQNDRSHRSDRSGSCVDPTNSDVQNENGITEEHGEAVRISLLEDNFYLDPKDTGVSYFTPNLFKISVKRPADDARLGILVAKMEEEGFELANKGSLGYLIFSAPLRRDRI